MLWKKIQEFIFWLQFYLPLCFSQEDQDYHSWVEKHLSSLIWKQNVKQAGVVMKLSPQIQKKKKKGISSNQTKPLPPSFPRSLPLFLPSLPPSVLMTFSSWLMLHCGTFSLATYISLNSIHAFLDGDKSLYFFADS